MKPLFGVNITENKKNDIINLESYICSKISQTSQDSLDKVSGEASEIQEKMKAPLIVRVAQYVLGLAGVILLRITLNIFTDDDVTFSQAMEKAPWLIPALVGCFALFGVITFYIRKKQKNVVESDEHEVVSDRIDLVCSNIYAELGVPQDAKDVDILSFKYKEKDGKIIPKEQGVSPIKFINFSYKVFVEDGKLYIADLENKYCIPYSRMVNIETVNKNVSLPLWNKETEYNKGEYKQYKISYHDGLYNDKPYYILTLECNGEELGIYFPSYELPFFESITGLKAEK